MRVPVTLTHAFEKKAEGPSFEDLVTQVAVEQGLLPAQGDIYSTRFLARSIIPHVEALSSRFNREDTDQGVGLEPYWKSGSNPGNLRLAYFLYFMPPNLYRTAAVMSELARLGYRWSSGEQLRGIEWGAGPAAGATGVAAAEEYSPVGIPKRGDWALIEQDKAMLELGKSWCEAWFKNQGLPDWGTRPFHRKVDFKAPLLPAAAPKFNFWLMSFFLNEFSIKPEEMAEKLLESWSRHLDEEGLVVMIEPALRAQSRRMLELRRAILEQIPKSRVKDLQILLPCLGHQNCGALGLETDWCHEEVSWWRPSYFRTLDRLAGLDRKTLPFSYLVFTRSKRPREEILPALKGSNPSRTQRLVSPAHAEGKDQEFFICGQEGKRRARFRGSDLERGDVLLGADVRGDVHSSRVQSVKKIG